METIQEFVDRTKGPLVPYVDSWYPWVYAHHYLRTEMPTLPAGLGTVGPRMSLDEAVELVQVWCGLTGESIEVSARTLADAYLLRWGVPADQIGRPVPQVPVSQVPAQPAEPVMRNQAPVSPVAAPRMTNRPPRSRSVKARGVAAAANGGAANGGAEQQAVPEPAALPQPVPEERLVG
ncbi:MAG: hypothetical protein V7603_4453 [Micromonosporaceae bacterium]